MSSSEEVHDAVGTAAEDAEIEQLQAELAQPLGEREQKAQRLAELEAQRAAKRRAQLMAVAERRPLGIRRAPGSVRDQLDQDEARFVAAVDKLVDDLAPTFNDPFEQDEG